MLPKRLPVDIAQARLALWSSGDYVYNLHVLDNENWVITKRELPMRFLRPLQMYRTMVSEWVNRGGLPETVDNYTQTENDDESDMPEPWDKSFAVIWVILAHDYGNKMYPFLAKKNVMVKALRDKIAWFFQHEKEGVRLSTHNAPLPMEALIRTIVSTPIIAHLREKEKEWDYSCRWLINWGDESGQFIDTLDQSSEPPSPSIIRSDILNPMAYVTECDEDGERHTQHERRGGGAGGYGRGRPAQPIDQKTAMITWAHQRITSELPNFNPATAMMLLKAEGRTVTTALYCKKYFPAV